MPDAKRSALADLQRDLFEAHGLCITVSGIGVVGGGRFQVSLVCPDSEWLDVRRNVFELGGNLPPSLRKGLEATIRGAARAWKLAPAPGGQPGLALISTLAQIALHAGAAPKRKNLDALDISQVPGDPTSRACLAAIVDLILSGEAQTPDGRRQVEELAQAVAVLNAHTATSVLAARQTAQAGGGTIPLSQRVWVNPTGGGIRGIDPSPQGKGYFGASRTGRIHKGVDIKSVPKQTVVSPTNGTFSRTMTLARIDPITNRSLTGIEIEISKDVFIQLLYVDPATFSAGQQIKAGDPIGVAWNIVPAYGRGMTNHVHVEIEDRTGGSTQFIDPTQFIPDLFHLPRRRP